MFINAVVTPLLDTVRKLWPCVIREMRILFGMILTVLRDGGFMRIWFGLILKITARMKSYILPELRYFDKINRLMREITILFGVSPQLFQSLVVSG